MPISRLPRSDWLGSSTSQFLIKRSNLSFGAIAAMAGAPPGGARGTAPPSKPRRDRTDIASSPMVPVSARLNTNATTGIPMRRCHTRLIAALFPVCLTLAGVGGAWAEYPDRPIRVIVPFPAGGTVDLVARLITARMADDLKTSFMIENRGGAGGVIATDAAAKAAADGYTLLLTSPNHTINAALQGKLPYDTEKDLVPVAMVAEIAELLVSPPSAPFTDFAGFFAYARANPGKLNYASAGNGTLPHVT